MDEKRKVPRHRTLKAGSITFNRAGGIDCRVRNLSPAGACLEVASQLGIPDEFVLVVEIDHVKQPCHVIWRSRASHGRRWFEPPEPNGKPVDRAAARAQIAAPEPPVGRRGRPERLRKSIEPTLI